MSGKQLKIAISGKAGAGKNVFASFLVQGLGLDDNNSKIVALADPMKSIIKMMFPEAKSECLFGPSELRSEIIPGSYKNKEGNQLTYRQALIDLGAFGRKYNDNMWLNCLAEDANTNNKDAYIISDVRFGIEFNFLKKSGFYMIRVIRDCSV